MKMSNGEKWIFATAFSGMQSARSNCTVEDRINTAASAVTLFREADMAKLTGAAKAMWLEMSVDDVPIREKDC